ncbi:exosome complex exonuclease RRP44-like [Petromyzon marinus]|uniref:exosome complex exonuclease RRP44-like n=1 Tax=Petromyzon marinus TaxID=7757 RepID=UPI003F72100D
MRRPTGKVVGIIKRNSRPLCGMLMPSPIKEATRHLFTPADRRMPRVRVETRQAASLQAHRIVVAIGGWLRHSRYPNGHFVRSLGECGDKETETEVLLLEHDVPHQPFSQAVLACLPPPTFSITAEVRMRRTKRVVSEEGFVLFVRKNAVVVLIPKYGLEGTVFFDSKDLKLNVTFDEEGPTLCVEGIALNMFDRVCVRVSLDSSNLQHQRIRMHLVCPEVLTVRRDAQPRNTTDLYSM